MRLAISPCPNDTFIFYALLHNKVDTEGLSFDVQMLDIDELNTQAQTTVIDAIKISYAAYPKVHEQYCILSAGSALGYNSGPLLVSAQAQVSISPALTVAIPGQYTTAALLLQLFCPQLKQLHSCLFSDISHTLSMGKYGAGVLIHETRFTYAQQGLHLIADLGALWQERFKLPLPLGCIAINRHLPIEQQHCFARVMRRSVEYALNNSAESRTFVRQYAQELSDNIIDQHIQMFVNKYTIALDKDAKQAIQTLLQGKFTTPPTNIFVDR
ncbi:MAG: 1,4-dihydroxy-6-naphthoate synthase [Bacteroidales bacterium]